MTEASGAGGGARAEMELRVIERGASRTNRSARGCWRTRGAPSRKSSEPTFQKR
jgi:hypothetical protein